MKRTLKTEQEKLEHIQQILEIIQLACENEQVEPHAFSLETEKIIDEAYIRLFDLAGINRPEGRATSSLGS